MSTLDQAFIRAYQGAGPKQAPRGDGARPIAADPAPVSPAPSVSSTSAVSASSAAAPPVAQAPAAATDSVRTRTAIPTQVTDKRQRYYLDGAHDAYAAAPHYLDRPAPADTSAYASAGATTTVAAGPSPSASRHSGEPPATARNDARAAFETERFTWPRNVEVLIAAAGSEFTEFARELSARVAAGRKTLAVTGIERGEGRTTLLLALARMAANRNLRTVIVDADFRAPQLAEQLGVRPEIGWDDVYAEHLPVTDALVESLDDRLTLLPMRGALDNPRGMAGNTALAEIVAELRAAYDLVLFDIGPLADDPQAVDLAAVLTGCALDDALVVRDRRRTNPKQVQGVCRRLAALGVRHWDIVENFCELQGY